MEDHLLRSIAKEAGVRSLVCVTTDLVNEAARRHQTSPTTTAALARALTGAALLGALLKVRQRVAIKFEGDGPLHKLIVESDAYGKVRGYVANTDAERPFQLDALDPYDTAGALGTGKLTVVKDLRLADLAESVLPMAHGDIARDLDVYLNESEQLPSEVQIGVILNEDGTVAYAGGLLIQNLADHELTAVDLFADRLQEMPPIAQMLRSGHAPADIVADLFHDVPYDNLEERPLRFHCGCSRERAEKGLIMLGREELMFLILEGEAIVDCHFCHERYVFDRQELEELVEKADG